MLARRSVFEKKRDVSFEPVREDQKVGKEIREADGGPRTGEPMLMVNEKLRSAHASTRTPRQRTAVHGREI